MRYDAKNLVNKTLKCSICGNMTIIQRRRSRNRASGHVKHMWCSNCKRRTAFIEL